MSYFILKKLTLYYNNKTNKTTLICYDAAWNEYDAVYLLARIFTRYQIRGYITNNFYHKIKWGTNLVEEIKETLTFFHYVFGEIEN